MLNTIVAESFRVFADRLEKAEDKKAEAMEIVRETIKTHKRIIFDGDGYSAAWREEAEKRGLLNLKSTVDAIPYLTKEENIKLFEKHGVLNRTELYCRADVALENYCKIIHIEALTLIEMLKRDVIPAISKYSLFLCKCAEHKINLLGKNTNLVEKQTLTKLNEYSEALHKNLNLLVCEVENAAHCIKIEQKATFYHDKVLTLMNALRDASDNAEAIVSREYWPYPSYGDLLFKV